jgi:hypothetical protein
LRDTDGNLPEYYDPKKLTLLEKEQVTWFDETHQQCQLGGNGTEELKRVIKFRRDEDGKLDLENGRTSDSEVSTMKVKYSKEVLPECWLYDDAEFKSYHKRPPGNNPEMMPWDEQLNNTVQVSLMFHAIQTHHLESSTGDQSLLLESDPRKWKFDRSTLKRLSYAFRRTLEVIPTSESIEKVHPNVTYYSYVSVTFSGEHIFD